MSCILLLYNIYNFFIFFSIFILSTIIIPIIILLFKPLELITNYKFNWQLCSHIFIFYLCRIENKIISKEKLIDKGYIICNHRCFFDFAWDPYICNASIVGRQQAFFVVSFFYILGFLDNRMIAFKRGKTSRNSLFNKITDKILSKQNDRILFYPEGTRKNYLSLNSHEDIKKELKFGLLKSIFESKKNNLPIQICITSNKEHVFNEKKIIINFNKKIKTCFSCKIYPNDFNNFDDFINKICKEWYRAWLITHK